MGSVVRTAFFGSPDDHDRVLLPFIKEGFERGDNAVHIIDAKRRDEHARWLAPAGIDAIAKERQ